MIWKETKNTIYVYLTCRLCNMSLVKNRPGWKAEKIKHELEEERKHD